MKMFDDVRIVKDCEYYNKNGIYKGRIGTIISGEIRDNCFLVVFIDERFSDKNFEWTDENMETMQDDIFIEAKIEDLEVVKEGNATDEDILESIPLHNKEWWCKVEDGYIVNLLGEKKNKIPYVYDS